MENLNPKPSSIKDFQDYLNSVYSEKNAGRDIEYLFSYLFRNISYLSRSTAGKKEHTSYYLKSISWLFAISSKLNINLENEFLKKFPGVCPYCITSPCSCMQTGKKPTSYVPEWKTQEELKNKYNTELNNSPRLHIDQGVKKINDIYPANRHIWATVGPVFHFSRILEELGEIHEAYTGFCKDEQPIGNVAEELADVLAWLLSAWGILTTDKLSDALITYYYKDCPVCHEKSCNCTDYASRGQRLVKIDELLEFKHQLEELIRIAPEKINEIETVKNSIDIVIENPSTTAAKRTLNQGITALETIDNTLGKVEGIGSKISAIAKTAITLGKSFEWMN